MGLPSAPHNRNGMTPHGPDNPWSFRRDEFHLLEDAFEDVLRSHDAASRGAAFAAEEALIEEQSRTESLSEAELSMRVGGTAWMEAPEAPCDAHGHDESDLPIAESLRRDAQRHPLYARALRWSMGLFRHARARYDRRRRPDPDLYRILLNAPLVPMKVNFALCEAEHPDAFAADIAQKECELAQTYARRTLEALERLAASGLAPEGDQAAEGRALLAEIAALSERMARLAGLPPEAPV